MTLDVPEEVEWATYDAERTFRISTGGGHNFTSAVAAKGDSGWYDFNGLVIRVSDIVERSEFEGAVRYQKGTGELYKKTLLENVETDKRRLAKLPEMGYGPEVLAKLEQKIEEQEKQATLAVPVEHDLGIPDATFLGGPSAPAYGYVYRNQRVYFFAMREAGAQGAEAFKELIDRFRPRDLYEVPKGPGVCIPYGFIADDGKTGYSIKNSLRFTSTPNVIFTLVTASANDPWDTPPTTGTYDTDYSPGYDGKKWELKRFIEPSYIGGHLAGLEGWQLEPKPDS
ncbi:T6SS immunity protein Tli4 family protein, partial [Halopseudomonas pelagia]|uniref:T6SS immunity protein Tli4 family protein n=1 Tax=Halopseudomonas pelagia TaxID=553151 RepID=UPI0012687CAC